MVEGVVKWVVEWAEWAESGHADDNMKSDAGRNDAGNEPQRHVSDKPCVSLSLPPNSPPPPPTLGNENVGGKIRECFRDSKQPFLGP